MIKRSTKSLLVFCIALLILSVLTVVAFAEKTDFAATDFSDITAANGWVHIASKSAVADDDGKDIELYYIAGGEAYLNRQTKTLVFLGKNKNLTGSYGDWKASETKNAPGAKYYLVWWGNDNSDQVEHLEFRDCAAFNNPAYFLQTFKHVKTVKFAPSANGTYGSMYSRGLFSGMTSLITAGHGTFDADGKFTPITYKEGFIDLTGFTYLKPLDGTPDSKAVMYQGGMFYNCSSITEVVLPATMKFTGSYIPAVEKDGKWVKGTESIEAVNDQFGGEYAGIFAKQMFSGTESLSKVTVPAEVKVVLFEQSCFFGSTIRCIDILGTVSENLVIEPNAFSNVASGCIIRCARAEDIAIVNKVLEENNILNVKATDMTVEPLPVPTITKLPAAPAWKEFVPETSGATAYGSMTGTNTSIWWAYFQETKTLHFYAKEVRNMNDTSTIAACDDGAGWTKYKEEIEHIVVGPAITKVNAQVASGMINLKDIEMTSDVSQAVSVFKENPNLTTIFITGMERVEGQAMLAGIPKYGSFNFTQTAVEIIHMGNSPLEFVGNIVPGPKTSTLIFDAPSDSVIAYCQENYLNVYDSSGKCYGEWYVEVPEGLPFCGDAAVFDFDEETGTLSILGKGPIADIKNYWGGGSKDQPWFSIRDNIKHVIIGDYITAIGKYSFTECKNLETVELPATSGFSILSSAFQECNNLKSVYIRGNQPIEGTVDVSVLDRFETYMFANCYLIANVVINENVEKIGASVFENCVNIQNIYGVPGSFAQQYAMDNGFTFFDKSANTPQPITCTPPSDETTVPETDPDVAPDTTVDTAPDTTPDTTADTALDTAPETQPVNGGDDNQATDEGGSIILPIVIAVISIVVLAVVVAVVVIAKKKTRKTE